MAGQNGGKRPGAGRPKGAKNVSTFSKEQAREALRTLVLERMRELTEAQMSQAMGLKYLVTRDRKSGKFIRVTEAMARAKSEGNDEESEEIIEVWEKDPSTPAFTDLMNRALDKPKEQEQDVNANVHLEFSWKSSE